MRAIALLFFVLTTLAAAPKSYEAGVAKVDITPRKSIWMSGYGNRNKPSTGVLHPLWTKALAIRDTKKNTLVIVSTDLIGLPQSMTDAVSARVEKEYGIKRANLVYNSSHTHTGPYVRANLVTMFSFTPQDQTNVEDYGRDLTDNIFNAIGSALARMEAVDIAYGTGSAGFAVNRRVPGPGGFKIGVNPKGPTDHTVPVLRVTSKRLGKPLAVIAGYACHNTTLTGEFYEMSGDYAGYAQIEMENNNPGAVAMFLMLTGADQNPNPRSSLALAKQHGKALADAAQRVLDTQGMMKRLDGEIAAAFELTKLNFDAHTRTTFEKELTSSIPAAVRRAQFMLKAYDEGHPVRTLSYPVQAVSFGKSLTLLALAGEVVIDYTIRAQREFGKQNLVVLGYSNDVPCYIPSLRVLREGGYEANDSMIYYGQPGPFSEDVEETIFAAVRRVMKRVTR
jgi:neutral ceramidase